MREEFEKLKEVAEYIKMYKASYVEENNYYFCDDDPTNEGSMFLNGAYYAFQEQQKKIDAMCECMDEAIRLIDEGNSWDAKELLK